jgi:hypothetical protein
MPRGRATALMRSTRRASEPTGAGVASIFPRGPADGDRDHAGAELQLGDLDRINESRRRLHQQRSSEGDLQRASTEDPGPLEAGEVFRADLRYRRSPTTAGMGRGRSHCRENQGQRPVKGRYIPFAAAERGGVMQRAPRL